MNVGKGGGGGGGGRKCCVTQVCVVCSQHCGAVWYNVRAIVCQIQINSVVAVDQMVIVCRLLKSAIEQQRVN